MRVIIASSEESYLKKIIFLYKIGSFNQGHQSFERNQGHRILTAQMAEWKERPPREL